MKERTVFMVVGVFAVVVCGIFLSYGFGATFRSDIVPSGTPQTAGLVPFTTFMQSTESKIRTRTNYRITSADDLAALWNLLAATGTPPAIDFSTHEVLAVFAGQPESSAIQVSKVKDTDVRNVLVTIVLPAKGCVVTHPKGMVPYELVSIAKSALPITHQDVISTSTCSS